MQVSVREQYRVCGRGWWCLCVCVCVKKRKSKWVELAAEGEREQLRKTLEICRKY